MRFSVLLAAISSASCSIAHIFDSVEITLLIMGFRHVLYILVIGLVTVSFNLIK